MPNRSTILLMLVLLLALPSGSASAAGICNDALHAVRDSTAPSAEGRPFPIQCNWNYMFALEEKMLRLGDVDKRRPPEAYDDQIDPIAIKRAQRRVGAPQTGIVDLTFFVTYMSQQ